MISFSYCVPSWLSNLRVFDLGFGFLVQNCIISPPEPQIWTKNDENPLKSCDFLASTPELGPQNPSLGRKFCVESDFQVKNSQFQRPEAKKSKN